jgi:serine/threonine protein phosphatase PrpC
MWKPKLFKGKLDDDQESTDPPKRSSDLTDKDESIIMPADQSANRGTSLPLARLGDGNTADDEPGPQDYRTFRDQQAGPATHRRDANDPASGNPLDEPMASMSVDYRGNPIRDDIERVAVEFGTIASDPPRWGREQIEVAPPPGQHDRSVMPEAPIDAGRPEERGRTEMCDAFVSREITDVRDRPAIPEAPMAGGRPEERGRIEFQKYTASGPPEAARKPAERVGPGAHEQPPRWEELEPGKSEEISVSSQLGADKTEHEPPAGSLPLTGIPVPIVLVGNPRTGSNPGVLPAEPTAAPDSLLDGAQYPGIVIRAASLRGDVHRYNGETRQDSIGLWSLKAPAVADQEQPLILACVADGVGSYPLSHIGSAEACWLLRQHVTAHLDMLLSPSAPAQAQACRQVISEVASGLRVLAAKNRLEPKQVSTTLAAALIIPTRKGQGAAAHALLFGVGDSTGFLLREGRWTAIPEQADDEGDVISTGTNALPTRPETCQIASSTLYIGDMLMLCTDGLAKPFEGNESVRDRLAEWWGGHPPGLPEFYWQLSFRAQTYVDDRSVVCAWFDDSQ